MVWVFFNPSIHVPRNGKAQKVHVGCAWPQRVVTLHFLRSNGGHFLLEKVNYISRSIWGGKFWGKKWRCLNLLLIISQDNEFLTCSPTNSFNISYNSVGGIFQMMKHDLFLLTDWNMKSPDSSVLWAAQPKGSQSLSQYFTNQGKILEIWVVNLKAKPWFKE